MDATAAAFIPKGRLWARGLALAETDIGNGLVPIGRWQRAEAGGRILQGASGVGNQPVAIGGSSRIRAEATPPAARPGSPVPAETGVSVEETGFETMAA